MPEENIPDQLIELGVTGPGFAEQGGDTGDLVLRNGGIVQDTFRNGLNRRRDPGFRRVLVDQDSGLNAVSGMAEIVLDHAAVFRMQGGPLYDGTQPLPFDRGVFIGFQQNGQGFPAVDIVRVGKDLIDDLCPVILNGVFEQAGVEGGGIDRGRVEQIQDKIQMGMGLQGIIDQHEHTESVAVSLKGFVQGFLFCRYGRGVRGFQPEIEAFHLADDAPGLTGPAGTGRNQGKYLLADFGDQGPHIIRADLLAFDQVLNGGIHPLIGKIDQDHPDNVLDGIQAVILFFPADLISAVNTFPYLLFLDITQSPVTSGTPQLLIRGGHIAASSFYIFYILLIRSPYFVAFSRLFLCRKSTSISLQICTASWF